MYYFNACTGKRIRRFFFIVAIKGLGEIAYAQYNNGFGFKTIGNLNEWKKSRVYNKSTTKPEVNKLNQTKSIKNHENIETQLLIL